MKSEVYKENVITRGELVARIMNSVTLIKQERQTTSGELHLLSSREVKMHCSRWRGFWTLTL